MRYTDRFGKPLEEGCMVRHFSGSFYIRRGERLVSILDENNYMELSEVSPAELYLENIKYKKPQNETTMAKMKIGTETEYKDKNGVTVCIGDRVTYRNNPYDVNTACQLEAKNGALKSLAEINPNYLVVLNNREENADKGAEDATPAQEAQHEQKQEQKSEHEEISEFVQRVGAKKIIELLESSDETLLDHYTLEQLRSELEGRGYRVIDGTDVLLTDSMDVQIVNELKDRGYEGTLTKHLVL